jgi:hypothetical protein
MARPVHLRSEEHEWEIETTELGDFRAACACGHERLLTGLVVRGRANPHADWQTPYQWNHPNYQYRRRQERRQD